MEERGFASPAVPLVIEQGDSGRVILQRADYQLLYLSGGRLYSKSAEGLTEQQADLLVVIPPGEGRRMRLSQDGVFYRICLEPWLFVEYRSRYWEGLFALFLREQSAFFRLPEASSLAVKHICCDMLEESQRAACGYREILRLKLSELFILLARLDAAQKPTVDITLTARGVREITAWLDEHYTEAITLEEVAAFAGYSPAYLSRYFKKATGNALFAYINRIRVQKACRLLKHTGKSILEIAYAVGYNNVSFFNRCFKRFMNRTPVEFRKGM